MPFIEQLPLNLDCFAKYEKKLKTFHTSLTMTIYFQGLWNFCTASKKYFIHLCQGKEVYHQKRQKKVQKKNLFSLYSCPSLRKKGPDTEFFLIRIWILFTQCLRKKKTHFIDRYGEAAEKARKYRKIDATSKTPAKTEAIVTEISLYNHKVGKEFIFVSIEEEDTKTHKNAEKRSGLQDIILGQTLMFKEQNGKFVQIPQWQFSLDYHEQYQF